VLVVTCRTSPSNGQATTSSQLRHPKLLACHSGAAFEGSGFCRYDYNLNTTEAARRLKWELL
jgi:hypothetical protein